MIFGRVPNVKMLFPFPLLTLISWVSYLWALNQCSLISRWSPFERVTSDDSVTIVPVLPSLIEILVVSRLMEVISCSESDLSSSASEFPSLFASIHTLSSENLLSLSSIMPSPMLPVFSSILSSSSARALKPDDDFSPFFSMT